MQGPHASVACCPRYCASVSASLGFSYTYFRSHKDSWRFRKVPVFCAIQQTLSWSFAFKRSCTDGSTTVLIPTVTGDPLFRSLLGPETRISAPLQAGRSPEKTTVIAITTQLRHTEIITFDLGWSRPSLAQLPRQTHPRPIASVFGRGGIASGRIIAAIVG